MNKVLLFALLAIVSINAQTGCWLESAGRGLGTIPESCPAGEQKDGALCYPDCKDDFTGVGPVCWENCPDKFPDQGAYCGKPSPYGRGAGYTSESACEKDNSQGCEKNGLLWYPKCADGFHAFGCCICSPNCPDTMTDIGVSCAKQSYGRGAGDFMTCDDNLDEDNGLCYPPCQNDFRGLGPVCWGNCPSDYTSCGALCLKDQDCVQTIMEMAQTVLQGVEMMANDYPDPKALTKDIAETVSKLAQELDYPMC